MSEKWQLYIFLLLGISWNFLPEEIQVQETEQDLPQRSTAPNCECSQSWTLSQCVQCPHESARGSSSRFVKRCFRAFENPRIKNSFLLSFIWFCACKKKKKDKPLTGMKLVAVGKLSKNKDDLKAAVEELGGKITGAANKASLCLSSKSKSKFLKWLIYISKM